jgi:hypothetical protein
MSSNSPPIDHNVEVAYFVADFDDRIRILVRYMDEWRPIFWLQVKSDGSIYLCPRHEKFTVLRRGSKQATGDTVSIFYNEGEVITDPKILADLKVSIHPSGVVHVAGDRIFRDKLTTISESQELCDILFEHPSHYSCINGSIRKRDICIDYPIDENGPLYGHLSILPPDKVDYIPFIDAIYQIGIMLYFTRITNDKKFCLQFVLCHKIGNAWPPYSYVIFRSNLQSVAKKS